MGGTVKSSEMTGLEETLKTFMSEKLGTVVAIESLSRMTGGASKESWSFNARVENKVVPLVLRRASPGAAPQIIEYQLDPATEYRLLKAAREAGVPVPEVHWVTGDPSELGTPGFIMERVEGETIPRRILREPAYAVARERMAVQSGEILARIHGIDPRATGLPLPTPADVHPARQLLDVYESMLDRLNDPHSAFEIGIQWLRRNVPQQWRTAFVHGDFRHGNFVVGPEGIRAVLDWEIAHIGDPMEDLGWLCVRSWRFGHDDKPVGGFGSREDLYTAYEAASGHKPDVGAVRFWEVFGNLKWGIGCMMQAYVYLRGEVRSLELAALGRRACEMEWDLLNLID
jgi:aminoglycoside phosphotransferase (APT) family kinase protein